MHAFQKGLGEPDQPSLTQEHLAFYYSAHFKKPFTLGNYGFADFSELANIIQDTVKVRGDEQRLEPQLSEGTAFLKFVSPSETQRQDRRKRIDDGDLSAVLQFAKAVLSS